MLCCWWRDRSARLLCLLPLATYCWGAVTDQYTSVRSFKGCVVEHECASDRSIGCDSKPYSLLGSRINVAINKTSLIQEIELVPKSNATNEPRLKFSIFMPALQFFLGIPTGGLHDSVRLSGEQHEAEALLPDKDVTTRLRLPRNDGRVVFANYQRSIGHDILRSSCTEVFGCDCIGHIWVPIRIYRQQSSLYWLSLISKSYPRTSGNAHLFVHSLDRFLHLIPLQRCESTISEQHYSSADFNAKFPHLASLLLSITGIIIGCCGGWHIRFGSGAKMWPWDLCLFGGLACECVGLFMFLA